MKAPGFWTDDGLIALALTPLSWLWKLETSRRWRTAKREKLSVPIICIGNLTAGGTGKTPTAIAVMELLLARGIAAHFVSRGYGGSEPGPLRVDPTKHAASTVGDEALLLAAFAPAWIGRDRARAAKAAIAAGAKAIILDDGFQNGALQHDLAILTIDAAAGFSNGRIIPAGPLREPIAQGLARADLVIAIGDKTAQTNFHAEWPDIAVLQADLKPLPTGMDWQAQRVLAFAGIGRPAKFFATLQSLGANVVATREFGDHETYSAAILRRLEGEAKSLKAQLVTTEKDAARLPTSFLPNVITLPVRLVLSDDTELVDALKKLGL